MPLKRKEVLEKIKQKENKIKNFENKRREKINSYLKKINNLKDREFKDLTGFCGAKPLEKGDYYKKFDFNNLDNWITGALEGKVIAGVDGSQIAPQKNYDIPVGLANSVLVINNYQKNQGKTEKKVSVITPDDFNLEGNYSFSKDIVNAERDKLEKNISIDYIKKGYENSFLLIDGPLVLSHANKMKEELREKYINKIISLLRFSKKEKVPVIGIVETSYSCDLVQMLDNAEICEEEDEVYDSILIEKLLDEGERTKVFVCKRDDKSSKNQKAVLSRYEEFQNRISFFYLNLGGESCCRVELPRWCFEENLITEITDTVRSEAFKGNGYPMILNKAHKKAVISYNEKEKFQKIIQKISNGNTSLKDIRKNKGDYSVYW